VATEAIAQTAALPETTVQEVAEAVIRTVIATTNPAKGHTTPVVLVGTTTLASSAVTETRSPLLAVFQGSGLNWTGPDLIWTPGSSHRSDTFFYPLLLLSSRLALLLLITWISRKAWIQANRRHAG